MPSSNLVNWLSLIFGIFFVVGSQLWSPRSFLDVKKALIAPPPYIEHLSFGFSEPLADALWIRSIQDFDYCEEELSYQNCKGNGWLAQMLDAITNLSPQFRMPYATGGLALTVVISDYAGASKIFDKAVKAFPTDWPLLYRAAYHALYEEKDKPKAARLLIQSAQNGGGEWFYNLAATLYNDSGNRDLGARLYEQLKKEDFNPKVLARMREKLGIKE